MLKLIPPGKRKNKYWVIRGRHEGHKIEQSTGCSLRADAERKLSALIREYENGKKFLGNVVFATAAQAYIEYRGPGRKDEKAIRAIAADALGEKLVNQITPDDIIQSANRIFFTQSNVTKNRWVITPAAAVMHYAAKNKWCDWLRISRFKEPKPKTRFIDPATEIKLLTATEGKQYLLLLWLFRQGDRIGDLLRIKYEDCDLKNRTIRRHVSKGDEYLEFPLDDEVCEILTKYDCKSGLLFPWRSQTAVNKWLIPLRKRLGVEFTPHRARHTLAKRLNDAGAGLRTIMQTLGHRDYKSSLRYQTTDIETVRIAKEKAQKFLRAG